MTLPNVPYAGLTAPQMIFLDQTFAAVSALGIVPCTASGTNLITLTPNASTPTISAYTNYLQFSFVASATTNGSVTLQVGSLAALKVFAANGSTQLGSGAFVLNQLYVVAFNSALDSGNGGWIVVNSASATGVAAGTFNTVTVDVTGRVTASSALRSYLAGMTISNDSSSPSRSVNISSGNATDSTNTTSIVISNTFNKTIGGAWSAGASNPGLGNGLTLSSSTWYHVFPIINNGVADVYLDTTSSAANAPTNTTAFRRVGSILTNNASTSGQISVVSFNQNGDEFLWSSSTHDATAVAVTSTASLLTLTVPLSVPINALTRINALSSNIGTGTSFLISSPSENDQLPTSNGPVSLFCASIGTVAETSASEFNTRTNSSQQVRVRANPIIANIDIWTKGWVDTRGRFI